MPARYVAFATVFTTALAVAPTQVQLHPSQPNKGELAVDFVSSAPGAGSCAFGARGADVSVGTTQFDYPNIGTLHQAVLDFGRFGLQAGDVAWYTCSADGGITFSVNTSVIPITAAPPRAAIFGDFGLQNDVVMSALAADAGNDVFGACHVSATRQRRGVRAGRRESGSSILAEPYEEMLAPFDSARGGARA